MRIRNNFDDFNCSEEEKWKEQYQWLWILNSVYIHPYFDLTHRKGNGFLNNLVKKLNVSNINTDKPSFIPPWSIKEFEEVFVGFTDGLHRFNDHEIIKIITKYLCDYIIQCENQKNDMLLEKHLRKAASMLENSDSQPNVNLEGDANKGKRLIEKYWIACFEDLFFNKNEFSKSLGIFTDISNNNSEGGDIDKRLFKSINRYTKKADEWKDLFSTQLKNTQNINLEVYSWMTLRAKVKASQELAISFFERWWRDETTGFKKTIIEYCSGFSIGRYSEDLKRDGDKNYPLIITALNSALFVSEEVVIVLAKILQDGPGVIVYPTDNVGAKQADKLTPFTLLQQLIQKDLDFTSEMQQRHQIKTCSQYLIYTYPDKKVVKKSTDSVDQKNSHELKQQIKFLEGRIQLLQQELAVYKNPKEMDCKISEDRKFGHKLFDNNRHFNDKLDKVSLNHTLRKSNSI